MKSEQIIEKGTVIEVNGEKLECTFVTWQELDGNKANFTYSFRPVEDMERERVETTIPNTEGQEA